MRRLAAVLLGAVALLNLAAAPAPPKALVDHVRGEINDEVDPRDEDPAPVKEPERRMFKRVDVNGDGIADWRVDFEGFYAWCGTGGCRQELWLGRGDGGVTEVFGAQVRELRLKRGKAGAVLDVDYHGSVCGLTGVEECPRRYMWDPAEMAFLPAINAKGDGLLVGLPASVVDIDLKDAPPEIQVEAKALADRCARAGGKREDPPDIGRLPDLNGDGVREWYVGSQYADCQDMTEPSAEPEALVIMVSQDGGPFTLAWGATQPDIGFDISSRPAVMVQFERPSSCDLTNDCPRKPMRWDPATRKLSLAP
ncbi:hypothetical protein QO010_001815 [Caulobacter ginsengisoli]|uniref:EF-hand domain-containing protein n=1 Tax=Caulobacter ginsengisoli TaxID=400775 RepID=A0ABU0IQ04_9CAUL|nr:hypothetical protein [Caulobacter ginsengisoli]MDQ0464044.1 hypothetical protein [Caulobacter ginsengisoli]